MNHRRAGIVLGASLLGLFVTINLAGASRRCCLRTLMFSIAYVTVTVGAPVGSTVPGGGRS